MADRASIFTPPTTDTPPTPIATLDTALFVPPYNIQEPDKMDIDLEEK